VSIYADDAKAADASSSRGQAVYRNLFDENKSALNRESEV